MLVHLSSSLTSRLSLVTLSSPIFLVSALNSEQHAKPTIVFTPEDLFHGVLEQLVEDDLDHAGDCKALVVVVSLKGASAEQPKLADRANKLGVKLIRFEELLTPSGPESDRSFNPPG